MFETIFSYVMPFLIFTLLVCLIAHQIYGYQNKKFDMVLLMIAITVFMTMNLLIYNKCNYYGSEGKNVQVDIQEKTKI